MGFTEEEIRAKLSMDTSMLGQAGREVNSFSQGSHSSFIHASNGAREYHKALHGIMEECPALGLALRALTSPIGAIFTGATIAFKLVTDRLKEWNQEMDEIQKLNAESADLTQQDYDEIDSRNRKMNHDMREWLNELHSKHDIISKDLERQLELNERIYQSDMRRAGLGRSLAVAQVGLAAMTGAMPTPQLQAAADNAIARSQAAEDEAERARLQRNIASASRLHSDALSNEAFWKPQVTEANRTLQGTQAQLQQARKTLNKSEDNNKKITEIENEEIKRAQKVVDEMGAPYPLLDNPNLKALVAGEKMKISDILGKRSGRINQINEERESIKRIENAEMDQQGVLKNTKGKEDEYAKAVDETGNALKKAKDDLSALKKKSPEDVPDATSPVTMSMSTLAGYNSYYGGVAREILRRQQVAQAAAAFGDIRTAQGLMDSIYTGNRFEPSLMSRLLPGQTTEQVEVDRANRQIKAILEALGKSPGIPGVPVNVVAVSAQ